MQPQPGFYKTRARRTIPGQRAVWEPVRLWYSVATDPVTGETLDRSPVLCALWRGHVVDPWDVWERAYPIDKDEYQWLKAITAIRKMAL